MRHVDDLLVILSDKTMVEISNKYLKKAFVLEDLGRASEFVGIALIYDENQGKLSLNQPCGICWALKKFNMSDCKPVASPMEKTWLHFALWQRIGEWGLLQGGDRIVTLFFDVHMTGHVICRLDSRAVLRRIYDHVFDDGKTNVLLCTRKER